MGLRPVESLQIGNRYYLPWQEAVEQESYASHLALHSLLEHPQQIEIHLPDAWKTEYLKRLQRPDGRRSDPAAAGDDGVG